MSDAIYTHIYQSLNEMDMGNGKRCRILKTSPKPKFKSAYPQAFIEFEDKDLVSHWTALSCLTKIHIEPEIAVPQYDHIFTSPQGSTDKHHGQRCKVLAKGRKGAMTEIEFEDGFFCWVYPKTLKKIESPGITQVAKQRKKSAAYEPIVSERTRADLDGFNYVYHNKDWPADSNNGKQCKIMNKRLEINEVFIKFDDGQGVWTGIDRLHKKGRSSTSTDDIIADLNKGRVNIVENYSQYYPYKTLYSFNLDGKDISHVYESEDAAMIGALATKYLGVNSGQVAGAIMRMLGIKDEWAKI